MAQIEVQPGSNITVTVNKGPLSGGRPAGNIGDIQYNVDGSRFGNVLPLHYDSANAQVVMGNVGTVALVGGITGQVVTNLGEGVLGWGDIGSIANGTTNIVANPANIQVSVGAQPNIATITEDDLTFRGHILPEANITYDLGSPTQRWRDIYLSNATIDMGGVRLSSDGESIVSSGGLLVQGALISREFYGNISGDYLRGDGSEIFNINGANVIGSVGVSITSGVANTVSDDAQPNITSLGTLTSLSVSGDTDLNSVGNVRITGGTNGQFLQTNGSGDLQFATVSLSNINSSATKVEVSQYNANITIAGNAIAEFGNASVNIRKSITLDGNLTANGNISANRATANTANVVALNVSGNSSLGSNANVRITGGNSGQSLITDGLGNLKWDSAYQLENGSSNVVVDSNDWIRMSVGGIGNSFIVREDGIKIISSADSNLGNVVRANFFYGNTISATNFDLGNVEDVTLLGGNINEVLRTDGAGNLSFHFIDETAISNATSNVQTTEASVTLSANGIANIVTVSRANNEGRLDVVGNTHIGGTIFVNAGNINGQLDVLGDLDVSGNTVLSNLDVNGNTVLADLDVNGNTVLSNLDVSGNTVLADLDVNGNSILGSNSNVKISGGASGQSLQTDGNGNLSWVTVSNVSASNSISGLTSSVFINNDGTARVTVNNVPNVAVFSDTGVTLSANGQSNVVSVTSNGSHAQTTIQNDVTITGNLAVQGTTVTINTETQTVSDPIVDYGVGANSHPLIIDDGEDRGLALHTFGRASQYTTSGVTHSGTNIVRLTSLIDIQLYDQVGHVDIPRGTYVDALYPGNTSIRLSAATTKSISNGSLIEIGLDAIHFIGWDSSDNRFVIASNTSIGNNQVTYNQYGNIRMGNITVDRIALANSVPTANINSVLISDSTGNIVWDTLDRGIY